MAEAAKGLVLTQAAQFGVKGAVKKELETGENYQKLVREADERIDKDRLHYAQAYKKASAYMAR